MDKKVIWTSGATADLQEIYTQRGEDFLQRVDAAISLLRAFPEQAPVYSRKLRRLLVGKDRTHGLFYAIEGRRLVFVAVFDLRQDPDRISELLRKRLGD